MAPTQRSIDSLLRSAAVAIILLPILGLSAIPAAAELGPDSLAWPATGFVENGDVRWHITVEGIRAVDVSLSSKAMVTAAAPGEVVWAGAAPGSGSCTVNGKKYRYPQGSGLGNYVVVKHSSGETTYFTEYAHFEAVSVGVGQVVGPDGPALGKPGSSGCSTGVHLHLEIGTVLGADGTGSAKITGTRLWAAGDDWPSGGTVKRGKTTGVNVVRGSAIPGSYPGLGGSSLEPTIVHTSGPAGFVSYASGIRCPAVPVDAELRIAGWGAAGTAPGETGWASTGWPAGGTTNGTAEIRAAYDASVGTYAAHIDCVAYRLWPAESEVLKSYAFTQTVTEPGRDLDIQPDVPVMGGYVQVSSQQGCQAYGDGGIFRAFVGVGVAVANDGGSAFGSDGLWPTVTLPVSAQPGAGGTVDIWVGGRCEYPDKSLFLFKVRRYE